MFRFLNAHFPRRTVFLGVSEACLVSLAFVIAAVARLGAVDAAAMLGYQHGAWKILTVSVAFVTCMYYFDFYDSSILGNLREIPVRLVQVLGTVSILLALVYYLYPPLEFGRGILFLGIAFVALLLWFWRMLFSIVSAPKFSQRTLMLGDGPLFEPLLRELKSRPELGLHVVGRVWASENGNNSLHYKPMNSSADDSGSEAVADISHVVDCLRVSHIVVTMGERRGKLPIKELLSLKSHGIGVRDSVEIYEEITGKVPIESIGLGCLLFSRGFHISRFLDVYKRLASVFVSSIGSILSLPLLPLIALAIKATSRGPVLYRQKRVGRDGVVFDCYKFRTMRADAEADTGPTWATDDDPRITRIGRFLRQSRMDEIPQLWNVLKGDMSFVGPRPERPEFVARLTREIPYYELRSSVRPGITGWAQISYKYGNSVEEAKEKLRYDLYYIKNVSPGLDVLIFLRTIKTILLGRGAK